MRGWWRAISAGTFRATLTIVPRNLPGAGSLLAASRIFNTEPKDGTTLGLLVPTIPLDEKLENPAAKYRAGRLQLDRPDGAGT